VVAGGVPVANDAWRLRRAKSLIKLLALAPHHQLHRDQVIDALWPDADGDDGANSLHQVLRAARQALATATPSAAALVRLRDEVLSLGGNGATVWVDVLAFERAATAARAARTRSAYHAAIDLYTGDLSPEDQYDDGAEGHRLRLRQLHLDLLQDLARLCQREHDAPAAIEAWQRAVAADPALEEAHGALMQLYAAGGQQQRAVRQYQLLREALARELHANPGPASERLYQNIVAMASEPTPAGEVLHNFPVETSSFVGRDRELAELAVLLRGTRLLTLSGAGGCGKTRLATHVAASMPNPPAGGVWLVELAAISQAALVPQAVAAALRVREQMGRPVLDTLAAHIGSRPLLIVLDNCEHLVGACAQLCEALLRACPCLVILATSREPLRVPGEVVWRIASLALPEDRIGGDVDAVSRSAAVRLFVDRAQAVQPGFRLTPHSASAVASVVFQLDGIPLAIELAAARLTVLTVEQISARLDNCFALLTGGSRTALSRQQTLRATLDWSYALLSEPESRLFRLLAVFAGGFCLEAVEALSADDGSPAKDLLDLLARLIDKSLVVSEPHGDEMRYRLLEPVRQYASELLQQAGETVQTRQRHAAWCRAFIEQARSQLWTSQHATTLMRLEREHDNLRAALDWLLSTPGMALETAGLASALWQFWLLCGYLAEGLQRMRRVINAVPERSHTRATALLCLVPFVNRHGDIPGVLTVVEECMAIFREVEDAHGYVQAASCFAIRRWMEGHNDDARTVLAGALATAQRAGLTGAQAVAVHGLATVAWWTGEHALAYELLERSLAGFRQAPDGRNVTIVFANMSVFELALPQDGVATLYTEETLGIYREVPVASAIGFVLANLGNVSRAQGNLPRARDWLSQSVEHFRTIQDPSGLSQALNQLGNLFRAAGQLSEAQLALEESLELRRALAERIGEGRSLNSLGVLALASGDVEGARNWHHAALRLFESMGDRPGRWATLGCLGHLAMATGDYATALTMHRLSTTLHQQMQAAGPDQANSLWIQAVALWHLGDHAAAGSYAAAAADLYTQLGYPQQMSAVRTWLAGITTPA
jgi:predicted ATPase/DNA-binding SARP family transcriptional activator